MSMKYPVVNVVMKKFILGYVIIPFCEDWNFGYCIKLVGCSEGKYVL